MWVGNLRKGCTVDGFLGCVDFGSFGCVCLMFFPLGVG